jgi:hypothetical protein
VAQQISIHGFKYPDYRLQSGGSLFPYSFFALLHHLETVLSSSLFHKMGQYCMLVPVMHPGGRVGNEYDRVLSRKHDSRRDFSTRVQHWVVVMIDAAWVGTHILMH